VAGLPQCLETVCFSTQQHRFYAGLGLPSRTLYLCAHGAGGNVVLDRNLATGPDPFFSAITEIARCPDSPKALLPSTGFNLNP
jgi:hypothetical protein